MKYQKLQWFMQQLGKSSLRTRRQEFGLGVVRKKNGTETNFQNRFKNIFWKYQYYQILLYLKKNGKNLKFVLKKSNIYIMLVGTTNSLSYKHKNILKKETIG